ncbi:MAG: flagellar biosynthetic protein FliR [Bdellovibrionota bacterium]
MSALYSAYLLCFIRTFGMFALLPIPRDFNLLGLRASLSIILSGLILLESTAAVELSVSLVITQFFVGALLGLPCRLLISAIETWGELLDSGRGQTLGAVYNPNSEAPGSHSANFLSAFCWAILVYYGFLPLLIDVLFESFNLISINQSFDIFSKNAAFKTLILIGSVLQSAIIHYLPLAAMLFMLDLLVGFCSKALNNSHFYSENFQLKTFLSFILISLTLSSEFCMSLLIFAQPKIEVLKTVLVQGG